MEHGHRGPGLSTLIDRAEVDQHTAWGASEEVHPNAAYRYDVGPYRFDVHASGEQPPKELGITVEKRVCPSYFVTENQHEPLAMWASTEAVRLHTVQDARGMLQVGIDASPLQPPRLDVRFEGWTHWMEPRAGDVRTFRIDDRTVTIDSIERTTGVPAHVHARARVEAATARPADVAGGPGACGTTTPTRSALPGELAAVRTPIGDGELALGTKRTIAGVLLELREETMPARDRYHQPETFTSVIAGPPMTRSMIAMTYGGAQLVRSDHAMFRFEPIGDQRKRVRVRAIRAACDPQVVLPIPDEPVYVWLSSVGVGLVTFGPKDKPVLTLQLWPDERGPSLSATSEHAIDSRPVRPQLVGHVATMDALRIEVVDVVATHGTQRATYDAWTSPTGVPEVHLQLRVSRD
jgi:hypothetical protein